MCRTRPVFRLSRSVLHSCDPISQRLTHLSLTYLSVLANYRPVPAQVSSTLNYWMSSRRNVSLLPIRPRVAVSRVHFTVECFLKIGFIISYSVVTACLTFPRASRPAVSHGLISVMCVVSDTYWPGLVSSLGGWAIVLGIDGRHTLAHRSFRLG